MATNTSEWPLWSTTARLVVTNPAKLRRARRIADRMLDEIDAAASRFRYDSEINRIAPQLPRGVEVRAARALPPCRTRCGEGD